MCCFITGTKQRSQFFSLTGIPETVNPHKPFVIIIDYLGYLSIVIAHCLTQHDEPQKNWVLLYVHQNRQTGISKCYQEQGTLEVGARLVTNHLFYFDICFCDRHHDCKQLGEEKFIWLSLSNNCQFWREVRVETEAGTTYWFTFHGLLIFLFRTPGLPAQEQSQSLRPSYIT